MMNNSIKKLFLLILLCLSFSTLFAQINVREIDKRWVIPAADRYVKEVPLTITAFPSTRSAGGIHDFYSEGDYWWPDSTHPDGPYIQKDGMTNPDNFVFHRKVLIRMSIQVAALTAAYRITGDKKYALKSIDHLCAWFVNEDTKMKPTLLYAQAITRKFTGRGTGIIDTIHLIEVAQSIMILEKNDLIPAKDLACIKKWFADYLKWLTTHSYGIDEMNAKNNHGTCWVMQVAEFAKLVGDEEKVDFCRKRFKEVLLPIQMAKDGSFPLELKRTKPYNYSLFNLDAMSIICTILSNGKDNLWKFTLPDGRNMKKGIEFMFPYIADKSKWPYSKDVMYFDYYPVRQPALLFGGLAYNKNNCLELWKKLDAHPENEEIIRNFPVRQPVLWLN